MAKTKYKKKYNEMIIEHMKEGNSLTSFASRIGVAKSTIYEWGKKHEDFSNAIKVAQDSAETWWEDKMKLMVEHGVSGSSSIAIFTMKARFGWRDNTPVLEDNGDEEEYPEV